MNTEPLPIGMLINSIRFRENDIFDIFGFWYYKELGLPATIEERKLIFNDLLMDRCCQISVIGVSDQIKELIVFASVVGINDEREIKTAQRKITELMSALRERPGGVFYFDDQATPEGTSLPLDVAIQVDEDRELIIRLLREQRDTIELHLKAGWSLMDSMMNDLLNL